jgi:hypothetical protein
MNTIAVVLIVCFASLWLCALYLVPQLVDSLFRYRLWKVRDHLYDYILDRRLPDSSAVNEFLEMVEETIRRSASVTLSSMVSFRLFWKPSPKETSTEPFDFSRLSTEQQDLVNALMYEFYLSFCFKMVAGSPVGAFFLPICLIYYKNRYSGTAHWNEEFKQLGQLRYTLRNDRREPKDLVASVG